MLQLLGAGVRIRTHLDISVVPTESADATTFGDQGGHDIVPPVQDAQGNRKGLDYHVAWTTHMAPARREIFRHSSSPAFGGGSNSENNFLCRHVVNPGGTVSNPINCPAKDW